ncbi:ferrichrome ABC transporter permease [Paenibacillus segetis]|uniref:Ferrichrome ABC transporter permease n=2 Tax=Paenibacillus segetis TaxID=1325360 RepID=A0ABQ1YU98_9BACL|nr:ferrichrome ABC transporter permease [Paenibacillus segetis]
MSHNAQPMMTKDSQEVHSRPFAASGIIALSIILLVISIFLAISLGAADIKLSVVWSAIFHFDSSNIEHQTIMELRLPRVLGGVMVGASFAVAGAIMQGLTRNPMADSGLLGLNSGAGFAMAICFAFFPGLSFMYLMLCTFVGAGIGAGMVYGISSLTRGGMTPVRLVLAGAALSALFSALSEIITLHFNIGQSIAFWYAGGVAGTKWSQLLIMFPWVVAALLGAIIISRSISMLSLGEEIAKGLGQRTKVVRLVATILVLVLAGSAVSVVGPVAFVGLLIPHLARYLVGVDYRWIIPCSAVLGSLLVVLADLSARIINPPQEVPIGALISLIGIPFFLYLANKERREL